MGAEQRNGPPARVPPRRPFHLVVAVGAASAAYAGSLAWITTIQSEADRALIAERQPVDTAIALLRANHDRMADRLGETWEAYQSAAEPFAGIVAGVTRLHSGLEGLAARVTEVERLAGSVPSSINLPPISKVSAPRSVKSKPAPAAAPPTNGTSGASGG